MPGTQPPFSLFPEKEGAQAPGLITRVGARTLATHNFFGSLVGTLSRALLSPFTAGQAARDVSRRVTVRQIFFTGFEALPLVSAVAILVGATIIMQAHLAAALPPEVLGTVLVAVVLREVAPLTTAILIAGRSGTAIATELGNMRVNQEILGLMSVGIDPYRFVVWPRLAGTIVSIVVLTVYFGVMAILGGAAVAVLLGGASFAAMQGGFAAALLPGDLFLFLFKGMGLGVLVGWICCHFGLQVGASPTEVPQRASQAVVLGILGCVVFNTLSTLCFYWLVGPPLH